MADGGAESNTGKTHTGCFFERSCEGIHPTDAENQLSSERKGDGTLRESSTRKKVNENISESPQIESLVYQGDGVYLVKIVRGKTYTLPFAFATKPEIKISEGFPCIKHENVWYKFKLCFLDSLYLQNMQSKKYIQMYEDSEHVQGTGEGNEKTIKSGHKSPNECRESLESQTIAETSSLMMEGIRNSSVDTAYKAGGEIVTETDKKAGKRPESNRGETDQRDNEEKPIDEKEDKSKIGAGISSKGSTVRRFQEETRKTLDINFSQTQIGDTVQRVKKKFSGGETNKISGGHTDKTDEKEKDKSQNSKEEVNQSQGRFLSFRPLGETEKTPETDTSVEDFCEIEGREKHKKLSGNKDGDSNTISKGKPVDTCDGNASQISEIESNLEHTHPLVDHASDNTENKPEHTHPLGPDQKLENNSDDKIRRGLNVGETFEKDGAHTARNEKRQTPIRATHELKKADKNSVNGVGGKDRPKEKLSQKTKDQTDGKDIDEQLEEKEPGGEINREVSVKTGNIFEKEASEVHLNVTEKRIAVSTNTEHEDSTPRALQSPSDLNAGPKLERTHKPCQKLVPDVDVTRSLKGKIHEGTSSQTVAETTDEISQQETDHAHEGHQETSEVSLRQIEHAPDVNVTASFKGKLHEGTSSQKNAETTAEISQHETDHTQEGLRETSEVSPGQTEEKSHHEYICNEEKEAKQESSNRVTSDDGDGSSKGTLAVEDESMQGRENTSEGRTGQEGSCRIPKYVNKISSSSALPSEKISDQTAMAATSGFHKLDEAESFPCNENSPGNTQDLKLIIKYLKKKGKKNEADISKHLVSCSMNFQLMWKFYTQKECGTKMLDAIVANHHCKVSLSADDDLKEFFIFQVSNVQFQEESDVKDFVDRVIANVDISAQESLSIDSIGIDPKIQEDIQEKIKERNELSLAWIELVGEGNPITVYTVCHKDHQQLVMQTITEVITDATKSFNSHKETVTADFMWQKVMTRFEYLKEIGLKFPSTEIIQDENLNAFLLKGPRDEVKSVAGHLEELLKMAHKEVHEEIFSPGYQFDIFCCPEMCDYIDSSLPKLPVVWTPNHQTKKIHIFSTDSDQLKGIEKSIKGCVKERLYPLSKDPSKLSSEKIDSLKVLMKKHTGKIVIRQSESSTDFLVTTADDIFEGVDAAMQKIVSSEIGKIYPETCLPKKPDGRDGQPGCQPEFSATNTDMEKNDLFSEVSYSGKIIIKSLEVKDKNLFRKILMEDMDRLNQTAKEHFVSIEVSEKQSKVGFVLRGTEKKVQLIYDIIRTAEQQMQLQQDISGMAGAAEKVHKQMTPSPNATEKSEGSRMTDTATEKEANPVQPIRPPRTKKGKSLATENTGQDEGVDDAKAGERGLEQRDWSYPNGKKIALLKASSCDADVIIIPEKSDKDSQSHFGKQIVGLKVPDGTEGKAKTDLQKEIEQVLEKILETTVAICIKTLEGWNFRHYLKCFLYQIRECFMRNEPKACPIECVILLINDGLDYTHALEIIQDIFKVEQDKSEVGASQTLLLQEQNSVFKRIRVKVKKGQLHEAQTEVLVNTVDRSLDLKKGVISTSLLDRAGSGIQSELTQQYKGNISFGQVLKTGVGSLPKPCKVIYHGVLYGYEQHSDCIKVFKDFLHVCLEDANKKYKSIAFPPIGTGRLRYPKDLVASLLFQSVAKFEQAHPTSKLEEVIFVIYEKDQETLKVFEELYGRWVGASFEKVMEMNPTEPQGASPSFQVSKKAITEMNKDPSTSVGGTAPSLPKKSVVKEPASLDITEVDRSEGKDIVPPKAPFPGKEQHKNMLHYSKEERCCFFVYDVNQEEDVKSLEKQIMSSDLTAKFVYPYKSGEALVICTTPEEKDTLMKKLKKYKIERVGPQKIQGLTATVDPVIWRKAIKMKKEQDLVDAVQKQSGVIISCTDSSIQFKAVTSHQLKIAQEYLIKFAKETLEIKVQKRSAENSFSGDIENIEHIENVSQTDFLALQSLEIYSKWTQKFNMKFTHEKEILYVQGYLSYLTEEVKKEIEREIAALRGKQKVEITYDLTEIAKFKSAIDEAKSDKLLLVWDDDNKQVLVYSDSFEEIQKLKHKVEFKMGKKKLTGRRGKRFANQENTTPLLSEEEPPIEKKITRSFSWSQDATNIEVFKTLEGIVVKVYEADILRLDVDCIVNAANDNLQHGGGVAWVIAQGAGPEIDREGNEILKKRGQIKVGEQCVTTAGNLPYDCIIHTVGPRWSDYFPHDAKNRARCKMDLFNSIIGCFVEAEKRQLKSIALPAISSGIFAVPRHTCTEQYAMAVIHYSKTRTGQGLQEIHFIDKLPDIVKDMQLAFKRHLGGDGNARHIVKGGDQTTAVNHHAGRDSGSDQYDIPQKYDETFPKDDGQTEEKQIPAEPVCPEIEHRVIKNQNICIYKPNQKIKVNIYTDDIAKLTGVEAIACSDDRRGKGLGAVASTLLKIGKSKYENAKKKAFEKEAHFGDVIVTEGGDTNFHLVIHAVIPSYKDSISPQKHKEIVQKCYDRILDDVNNWQKASLALPLIGAGCPELGHEGSAKLFLDSLEVFCNRTMTLNIKIIHVVDKDEHITKKVAAMFIKHTEKVGRHLLATHGNESKPAQDTSSLASSIRPQGEISQVRPKTPVSGVLCPVCGEEAKSHKTLSCGHTFCIKCIEKRFRIKSVCPGCKALHRTTYGDQPEGGIMNINKRLFSLAGFEKSGSIQIEYCIPSGYQGPTHPKPGSWYSGITKAAYLPDTTEGRKVCALLKVAFERRLIFTFGRSSSGAYVLIWNDILHKTCLSSSGQYGYPDSGYLKRVQEQLAAKGVTEADLKLETTV